MVDPYGLLWHNAAMNLSIKALLDETHQAFESAELFYGHGTDNPWDEAVQLVLSVAELPLDSGEEVLDHLITQAQYRRLLELRRLRIEKRLPLPYLLQVAWFVGMPFYVDERVLIPRSLMGYWLDCRFEPFIDPNRITRIAEVGTGSGCISIVAAMQFPQACVDAGDISEHALAVARKNIADYSMQSRIQLLHSDCLGAFKHQYDLILSNPPYVSADDMAVVPPEYEHEPRMALEAEDDGLAIVLRLLKQAPSYLNDGGVMVIETGYSDVTLQSRMPDAPWVWLDTDADTSGLLLVTKEQLMEYFDE